MPDQKKLSLLSRISLILAAPAMKFAIPMLILLAVVTGALVKPAINIQNDDDVIKFLPQDDPKVVKFMEIGDEFHGLQMAIVGIEAKRNPDLFNYEDMMLIRMISRGLPLIDCTNKHTGELTKCVSNTTSFSEIKDISHHSRDTGEVEASVTDLVPDLPPWGTIQKDDPKVIKLLTDAKDRSLSLEHVRGFLVSPDARAVAIYAQVDDTNVSTKEAADKIRQRVEELRAEYNVDVDFYYGGSPFIGGYSADQARMDMTKLSPWVIAIVILIILVTSRSLFATIIALTSVGISMVWVMGGMSLLGIKMTLVATSLPILLVALGSAYAIHLISAMLSQLDKTAGSEMNRQEKKAARIEAMRKALILTGPPIIVCVLTTAAGFFSFLTMDVDPMVEYGASMGIATLIIMIVTFWFVTSACILSPIKPRKGDRAPAWAMKAIKAGANGIYNHGKLAAVIVALLAVCAGYFTTKVEPHGDNTSLFADGSLPRLADDFMDKNFGGSNFIQTEVRGDVINPLVLRQVERMTAAINAHPRIAGMQSFSDVAVLVGDTMGEGLYIPPKKTVSASMANNAYQDDKSTSMLVTRHGEGDYPSTLMQIRVAGIDISEGARLADELHEQTQHLYQPRIFVPRDKMDEAAIKIEQEEIIEHLQNIFKKYGNDFAHDDILEILNEKDIPFNKEDVRSATNVSLFDGDDAQIYMDEEKIKAYAYLQNASDEDIAKLAKPEADDSDADNDDAQTATSCTRENKSPECRALFAEQYDGEALDVVTDLVFNAINDKTYSQEWLTSLLKEFAEDEELTPDNEAVFNKAITGDGGVMDEYRLGVIMKSPRTYRLKKLFEKAGVKDPSEKFVERVEGAIWCLGDDVASLPRDQVSQEVRAAAIDEQTFEVIPSGYPVIYRAMNASVIHNQFWSLGASFIMVFLCLMFFTRSPLIAFVSLIPASLTVLLTFGTMGLFDIGMDVGSSMIAAISLSVGIDYACHLIWKFGRPGKDPEAQQKASDHMLETTGWGIVINALEVGLGLSILYFGELLPMKTFGLLTGLAMIVSAAASLMLLSGLLRFATKFKKAEPPIEEI